jgi:rRNA biogenesis protein RRP5
MAPPRGDRKKGKGAGGGGKTDLRPDRNQFKKHNRKEEAAAEQGGGDGEQRHQPGSAALLAAASDEADFPRGEHRAARAPSLRLAAFQFCSRSDALSCVLG